MTDRLSELLELQNDIDATMQSLKSTGLIQPTNYAWVRLSSAQRRVDAIIVETAKETSDSSKGVIL